MADPATAMIVGSLALSALGTMSSMKGAGQRDDFNQRILQQQADMAKEQAASQEETSRFKTGRLMASQRAGFAGAGVTFEGSPLAVISDTAEQGELEALRIRYGGTVAQYNADVQKNLSTFEKNEAKRQALMNFGGTLLTAGLSMGRGGGSPSPAPAPPTGGLNFGPGTSLSTRY